MADDEANQTPDTPSTVDELEPRKSEIKRLLVFLRSVMPGDPWQLVFLAGLVCLTVSPKLRWWPTLDPWRTASINAQKQLGNYGWYLCFIAIVQLIILGAASGYAACFWAPRRPVRRIALTICLPVLLGAAALLAWNRYWENAVGSIFDREISSVASFVRSLPHSWETGPGLHYCVFGIVLVSWFALRIWLRLSALPLALPQGTSRTSGEVLGQRPKIVLWLLAGPQVWVLGIPSMLLTVAMPVLSSAPRIAALLGVFSIIQFGLVLWIMGPEGRSVVRPMVRLPKLRWIGLAIAIPVGLALLYPIGSYVYDRIHWASFDFRRLDPPEFLSYLPVPRMMMSLSLLFAAAMEEVVYRGMLQLLWSRAYGVYRGVFLTTIAWAAYHFYWDASARSSITDSDVLAAIGSRVVMCLAIGYVLSWLTIRSSSLLPPIFAHTLYNLAVQANRGGFLSAESAVRIALWAVAAMALFWFWPIHVDSEAAEPVTSGVVAAT